MLIKDLSINERPRERLIKNGVETLSNIELLSIVLKTGTKSTSVIDLSNNILNEFDDIKDLKNITYNKLLSVKGIGKSKACELLSIVELGKRIYLDSKTIKEKYDNPIKIYESMRYLFDNKTQECFYCLYLNNKCELLERRLLFMGTLNRSIVHPREVFKHAYLNSAYGIVCVHNHPSGDVKPSSEDIRITKALIEIGNLSNIPLMDHIIIGNDNYYSMRDNMDIFL